MRKFLLSTMILLFGLVLIACDEDTTNNDNPIKVYTRDTNSGTRGAFFEIIGLADLGGSNEGLAEGYVEVSSNGDMMSSVKNDANGIGYISLSGLATSGLKGLNFNGVEATEANVLNNTYSLKRPFMYVRKAEADITSDIEKQLVNAFLAYMNSKDGKEIIANNDGIVEGLDSAPEWDDIKADHAAALAEGDDVEIHFGGSTSVEKIGRALSESFATIAPRFKPMHAHSGSGAAYTGTRADGNLHLGFASRELKDTEKVDGEFGQVAWDAVVIVVNNQNTLANITTEQIQAIFTGETKNWQGLAS